MLQLPNGPHMTRAGALRTQGVPFREQRPCCSESAGEGVSSRDAFYYYSEYEGLAVILAVFFFGPLLCVSQVVYESVTG